MTMGHPPHPSSRAQERGAETMSNSSTMATDAKIVSLEQAAEGRAAARDEGRRVVLTNGVRRQSR